MGDWLGGPSSVTSSVIRDLIGHLSVTDDGIRKWVRRRRGEGWMARGGRGGGKGGVPLHAALGLSLLFPQRGAGALIGD